jgi:hypothetical protein
MKTVEQAKANLEASITYIPERYKQGISTADWQTKAASESAEKNYADGVSNAVSKKLRQLGVRKVANTEWQNLAINKGGAVIGERIRASLDKQSARFAPIYQAVQSAVGRLTPRTTDFRANISNRVVPIAEAWKKAAGKL